MYRASNDGFTASVAQTAIVPDALIYVGGLSVTIAAIVVLCHLYKSFGSSDEASVFEADDKLLLVYFYSVVGIFAAVAISKLL